MQCRYTVDARLSIRAIVWPIRCLRHLAWVGNGTICRSVGFRIRPSENDVEKLMRNLILAFAALPLAACQSAPEPPQSAATAVLDSATIPSQPALDPAAVPPGSAIMDQSVTITPPSKSVPTKYAAFSGNWAGRLEGTYEGKLAVQSVSSNGKVTATYAWGILGDNNPGEAAGAGKIVGSTLKLGRLPNGADVSFMMMPDGTLAGTFTLAGQTYTGLFIRQ